MYLLQCTHVIVVVKEGGGTLGLGVDQIQSLPCRAKGCTEAYRQTFNLFDDEVATRSLP
jgi:hypothetical protein